jgi:hypothetical protein
MYEVSRATDEELSINPKAQELTAGWTSHTFKDLVGSSKSVVQQWTGLGLGNNRTT